MDLLVHLFVFVSSCFLVGYCYKLFGLLFLLVVESACKWTELVLGSRLSLIPFFTRELTSLKSVNPFFLYTRMMAHTSVGQRAPVVVVKVAPPTHLQCCPPCSVVLYNVQCTLKCCPPWSPPWSVGIKLPTGITARCR